MKFGRAALLLVLTLVPGAAGPARDAAASDHRDSPGAAAFPAADIADLYIFRSPADTGRLVIALDVNPRAPGEARTSYFSANVRYIVHVVTCRAIATLATTLTPDQDIITTFSGTGTAQTFSLTGLTTAPITGTVKNVVSAANGAIKVYCGPRDDPFFFDRDAFKAWAPHPYVPTPGDGLRRAGDATLPPPPRDAFAGWDVASIVIELPISDLAQCASRGGIFKAWAETSKVAGTTSKPRLLNPVR
jgi:hypothetical protein